MGVDGRSRVRVDGVEVEGVGDDWCRGGWVWMGGAG